MTANNDLPFACHGHLSVLPPTRVCRSKKLITTE